MYKQLIGEKVTIIVSSKGDQILEYVGTLTNEGENTIELSDVNISYLMLNIQKGFFGGNVNKYKEDLEKVIINKRYIISCNK